MFINDRQFVRRQIIWRLTNLKRGSLATAMITPKFTLLLGDNKTEW